MARHHRFVAFPFTAIIFASLATAPVRTASAASIVVNTCSADDLISAVNTANTTAEADTITLKAGCRYVLTSVNNSDEFGANGLPVISTDATIVGNGATIARDNAADTPAFRVMEVWGAHVELQSVTISGGDAAGTGDVIVGGPGAGGGIINYGTLTLTRSTVSGNTADYGGGGVFNGAVANGGQYSGAAMIVDNSTFSGNVAGAGGGGAINNFGIVTLSSATLSANSAGFAGGISNDNGVNIWNTIIAGNSAPSSPDCVGLLNSQGHNLIQDSQYCTLVNNTTGDLTDVDARLGPLQDNGGPTFTHALLADSPAIDAGNPDAPGSSDFACATTDQRGTARPQDGNGDGIALCDIGAYELAPTLQVTVDIRPLLRVNLIDLDGGRNVPVAIVTTDSFDATTVDPASVCFGDAKDPSQRACMSQPCGGRLVDVNGDGRLDLLLHYPIGQTGIQVGDRFACLGGKTYDGRPIAGCDTVVVKD